MGDAWGIKWLGAGPIRLAIAESMPLLESGRWMMVCDDIPAVNDESTTPILPKVGRCSGVDHCYLGAIARGLHESFDFAVESVDGRGDVVGRMLWLYYEVTEALSVNSLSE